MSLFRTVFGLTLYVLNTIFWFIPIFIFGLLKLLPLPAWQKWTGSLAKACASFWVAGNNLNQRLFTKVGSTSWYYSGFCIGKFHF